MRGIEEFEAAEFDERDVAPRQFEFDGGAVVRGAKQHRLRLQARAGLAVGEALGGVRRPWNVAHESGRIHLPREMALAA